MRGDTSSAFAPNTGTTWMNTTPRLKGSGSGASTTSFAAGCGSAVWAAAFDVHQTAIATTTAMNALVIPVSPGQNWQMPHADLAIGR